MHTSSLILLHARRARSSGQLCSVVRDILLPMLVHHDRRSDTWPVQVIEAMADAVVSEAYLRQLAALWARADSRPHLARIACPTLILSGRADAVCSVALHEEMAAEIPGARMVVIEQCGHLSAVEQPQTITALLRDWLRGCSEPESRRNAA
jgi:pimeloyl-ACP methyl ester carboxylesterase